MSGGRGMVGAAAISGLVALLAIAGAATAENLQAIALGPKQLEIVKLDDGTAEARVDEQVIAKNYFIEIETSFSDATGGAALLLVSDGSNGCAGQYQVVSVDAKGIIAHTDVFGDCSDTAEGSAANGSLSIRFPPIAGQDGALYSWSFAKGLEGPTPEPFQPKPGTSWADAAALAGAYPWEALDNADVYAAFKALLGPDFSTFTDDFGTADKMQVTADGIVFGTSFTNEGETSNDLFIAVDPVKRQVFAAMKPGDSDASYYPPEAEWPASLQAQLKVWP